MKTKLIKLLMSLSAITLIGCKRIIRDNNEDPSSFESQNTSIAETPSTSSEVKHNYSTDWEHDKTSHWHACTDAGFENLKKDEEEHHFVESQTKSVPATFESDGKKIEVCSICNFERETKIPKLEHTYSTKWEHDETSHWHSCIDTGYESLKKDENSHTFIEDEKRRVNPTFEADGIKYLTCSVCDCEKTEPIDKLEHNYSTEWDVDGTYHWHKCIDKGYEDQISKKIKHIFVEDTNKKVEPTFEADGKLVERCSICNYEKETKIPKLEHTYSEEWSSDENYHFHSCKDTGYENLKKDSSLHDFALVDGSLVCKDCSHVSSLSFELNSDGASYSIKGIKDKEITEIIIPESIDNKPVTSFGSFAFNGCSSLTSITIPNSMTSIGYGAFYDCSSMTSITIPDSVTSIGGSAFSGCSSLTSISIPNNVTSFGYSVFYGCSSLTSITIPNSITSIGEYAFSYCTSLTSITIPDSVTSIENEIFSGCSSLTSITVDENNPKYKSINNCIIEKDTNTLVIGCNSSIIPDCVTSIGYAAFAGCSSLTSITIPNSVTSIGEVE